MLNSSHLQILITGIHRFKESQYLSAYSCPLFVNRAHQSKKKKNKNKKKKKKKNTGNHMRPLLPVSIETLLDYTSGFLKKQDFVQVFK